MDQKLERKIWLFFSRLLGMDAGDGEHDSGAIPPGSKEEQLLKELSSASNYYRRRAYIDKINVEKELNRVIKPRKRVFLRSLGRVAAILLPLLAGTVAVYTWQERMFPGVEYANHSRDVKPGCWGAVLETSDGVSRELSGTSQVSERDGSEIKIDSGRLNYQAGNPVPEKEIIYNKLFVGRGFEYMLVLSDGTRVWMNSESELYYPVAFGKESRHVRLSGEAYFEVARDSARPFVVEVDRGFEVKVLGTRFNIKAYGSDDRYETTLVEGKVQVGQSDGTTVVLKPSEQMVIRRDGQHEVREVNTGYYVAWHDGWFYFNNEPLERVLGMLGRWYNVEFTLTGSGLGDMKVTGKVKRFENLSVILSMLSKITRVQFDFSGDVVTVKE